MHSSTVWCTQPVYISPLFIVFQKDVAIHGRRGGQVRPEPRACNVDATESIK